MASMFGEMMHVFVLALVSAVFLFILTKIIGQKQISQLSMFDYVTGITIGSIAAEMATEPNDQPLKYIVAMAVYAGLGILVTKMGQKTLKFRKVLNGKIYLLCEGGKLNRSIFKKTHLDLSDYLMLARMQGYYDPSQIHTAIMEPNGTISFLPFEDSRPATVGDLGLQKQQSRMAYNLIMDGQIMEESLRSAGISRRRLDAECKKNGFSSVSDVFLATVNDGQFTFY